MPTLTNPKPQAECPSTPTLPIDDTSVSIREGEQRNPKENLDKLKSGVINKLRQQQSKRSPSIPRLQSPTMAAETMDQEVPSPNITVDEGTIP